MRGVDLPAKMRTISRILGADVELRGRCFCVFCPSLDKTFTQDFDKERLAEVALRELHSRVYRERGMLAYRLQEGKCIFCGRAMPSNSYEIDHKSSRGAHGRNDRVDNLQAVCTGFNGCDMHRKKHGG